MKASRAEKPTAAAGTPRTPDAGILGEGLPKEGSEAMGEPSCQGRLWIHWGRSVDTTKMTATPTVTACEKMSQSLRIARNTE